MNDLFDNQRDTILRIISENSQLFAPKFMPYLPTEAEWIAEIDRNKIERKLISE